MRLLLPSPKSGSILIAFPHTLRNLSPTVIYYNVSSREQRTLLLLVLSSKRCLVRSSSNNQNPIQVKQDSTEIGYRKNTFSFSHLPKLFYFFYLYMLSGDGEDETLHHFSFSKRFFNFATVIFLSQGRLW